MEVLIMLYIIPLGKQTWIGKSSFLVGKSSKRVIFQYPCLFTGTCRVLVLLMATVPLNRAGTGKGTCFAAGPLGGDAGKWLVYEHDFQRPKREFLAEFGFFFSSKMISNPNFQNF